MARLGWGPTLGGAKMTYLGHGEKKCDRGSTSLWGPTSAAYCKKKILAETGNVEMQERDKNKRDAILLTFVSNAKTGFKKNRKIKRE